MKSPKHIEPTYFEELTRDTEVHKTFMRAARDLIPREKLPAFRIAAWRKVVSLHQKPASDDEDLLQNLSLAFVTAMVVVAVLEERGL